MDMRKRLEKQGRADLVPALIPEYPPGCKRITVSEDYPESLCRENVVVERTPIKEVRGRTIVTADGKENEFDVLCLATGFNVQGFLGQLQGRMLLSIYSVKGILLISLWLISVIGKNGQSLNEIWDNKFPETYRSVLINGYPNLFMILGPSSLLGHNSVVIMTEWQVDHI